MHSGCDCSAENGQDTITQTGALERPRYSPGLVLEASDLTAAVDYTRDLNRLLFRSLFGCGVICGLEVSVKLDCDLLVTVASGLALDGCGDPVHLAGQAQIRLGKKTGVLQDDDNTPPRQTDFWVVACYKEKTCAPRALVCDSDDLDGGTQNTRVRSAVEISVVFEPPACVCGCGTFASKPTKQDLASLASEISDGRRGRSASSPAPDPGKGDRSRDDDADCHDAHYNDPSCPADCGCGTACSCGCCVLLAWVHRFNGEDGPKWVVMHRGVRRFVRPALIPDPRWDFEAYTQVQDVSFASDAEGRIKELVASSVRASAQAGVDVSKLDSRAIAKAVSDAVMRLSPDVLKAEATKRKRVPPSRAGGPVG